MKTFCLFLILFFVNNTAYPQWSTDPNENLQVAVHGGNIHVVPDGNGGAILTFNNFDYDVVTTYLQAVDKYGYLKWNEPKIIADSPGPQNYSQDIFLNSDGSILVGYVSGYSYIDTNLNQHFIYDPYVQKIDSNGNKLWGVNGIRLNTDSTGEYIPAIDFCYDGDGGIFAFWDFKKVYSGPYTDSLYIQHISKDGERLWGENGVFIDDSIFSALNSWIVYDESGGIYLQYKKENTEYYIRKYNSSGNLEWTIIVQPNFSKAIKDGCGGIIISGVKTISPRQLVINRISSEGEKLWGEDGIIVDDSVGANYADALLFLNSDSTVSVFWDTEWYPTDDLYLQRYTLEGEQVWGEHLKVSEFTSPKGRAGMAKSDNNSNIIIWRERRDTSVTYAQKVDEYANIVWKEDKIISLYYSTDETKVITDGNDGAIIVWRIDPPWGGIYAQQISKNGNLGEVITSVNEDDKNINPRSFYLAQNYPNPFNPVTSIQYAISSRQFITLKVYDVLGNEVASLVNKEKPVGNYKVEFNGSELSSGIYFYQLKAASFVETKKMVLLK